MRHGHGHYVSYIHHGCRCEDCRRAWNVYQQHNAWRHLRGDVVSVDRHIVRTHIVQLMDDYGCTTRGIATAAGYGSNAVVRSALDTTKSRPVPVAAARRLMSVTYDTLTDEALVWGQLARDQVDRLLGHGLSITAVARVLGWGSWPGEAWPKTRVTVGIVRQLAAEADRLAAACEDCDQPALNGGRWCFTHFKQHATPVKDTGCGTDAGYARHRRAGQVPCRSCREAHNLAAALRKAG